jgi:hypothetical protein
MPDVAAELFAAARNYAAVCAPGSLPVTVEITLAPGGRVSLNVPPGGEGTPSLPADGANRELRDAIIDALEASPVPLKSSALARKVGRRPAGSFRALLRQMKIDGDVTTDANGHYTLPEE